LIYCKTKERFTENDMENSNSGFINNDQKSLSSVFPLKIFYIVFGIISFGLGTVGTVIPLIPTTPFILLSAVCFGKSSQRLHAWCVSTKFYHNNVEPFVTNRAMTLKSKVFLLSVITIVMGLSFLIMTIFHVPVPVRIILGVIWLCHVIYFGFRVKTIRKPNRDTN